METYRILINKFLIKINLYKCIIINNEKNTLPKLRFKNNLLKISKFIKFILNNRF